MSIKKFNNFISESKDMSNSEMRDLILDILLPLTDEGFIPRVSVFSSAMFGDTERTCEVQLEKPIKTTRIKSDFHGEIGKIRKMNELIYKNIDSIITRLEEFGEITLYEDTAAIRGYLKIELLLNK
jgi:hypothetical protein